MNDYQGYISRVQTQYLSAVQEVGEVQAKLLEAVRAVPTKAGEGLPSATEVVETSFEFATQLLDAQRDIALRLVDAAGVTPAKAPAKKAA